MILQGLWSQEGSERAAAAVWPLMEALYPICRSITGDGVRRTLDLLEGMIPLQRTEVASGTAVFDWEVPPEWNIREAYIVGPDGRRVVDFRDHSLHVLNYSVPVDCTLSLEELEPHLHSLPDQPDWIPYRTSYYDLRWGFCLRHRDRAALKPGNYRVVIDADLQPGHLTYAECLVRGQTDEEVIVYTHLCHPSLANDNLTGLAAAAALGRELLNEKPSLSWRFVFGPGTIGSLSWLAMNEEHLARVRAGFTIGLLGDAGPLTYKRSRRGGRLPDRVAEYVLPRIAEDARLFDFEPYGYDERQFCSPGFDLPFGRLTRSRNGEYPEYHTSADNLAFIRPDRLAGSIAALARMFAIVDANRTFLNLSPKGEPRLGKRGLYGAMGGMSPAEFQYALLWVLSLSDGDHDLLAIAERSGLAFETLEMAAGQLEGVGLLRGLGHD